MKYFFKISVCCCSVVLTICFFSTSASAQKSSRQKKLIDNGWHFTKGDPADAPDLSYDSLKEWILPTSNPLIKNASKKFEQPEGNPGGNISYVQPDFDDSRWQTINLPHDWAIGGPFTHKGGGGMGRLPTSGVGWYRKKIMISSENLGKEVFLDVDGAMSYATVWVNGHLAGGWPYGYTSWRLNITPYLQKGANQLAIRLDNPPNSSRWYPGAGIYRNVWLVKTSAVHIAHWGTFVKTKSASPENAEIALNVKVDNDSDDQVSPSITTSFFKLDNHGNKTADAVAKTAPVALQLSSGGASTTTQTVNITNPELWGPKPNQTPNRYLAITTVRIKNNIVDQYETKFGIRTLQFDPTRGLLVNGEPVEIKGVNMHHDLGSLGAAVNRRAIERRFQMLQKMGVNAIRSSHNPPAPEFLALADSMGILVMDEAFDCWQIKKTPNDYHLLFDNWHEQDLRAMVLSDRNHPSVFMWSVGNEVGEQWDGGDKAAETIGNSLTNIVHQEDRTRPTTAAMNNAKASGPFPDGVDIIGLNYQGTGVRDRGAKYPVFRKNYPNTFIYGSETAATVSSRGVYTFPVSSGKGAPVGTGSGLDSLHKQVSSYGLNYADFGASPDEEFESQDKWPYIGGRFVWAGWDYLGEPTPFDTSRSSYFGIIDLAGFKKNRFYLYQSQWRRNHKMAHILPHWTWPNRNGKITPVQVFSSADEAELFLNGKSLGRRKKGKYQYRFRWDSVRYEPGELKVVTYKNGKKWATDVVKTAEKAAKLKLTADRDTIKANGKDLSYVTLNILDDEGTLVPQADNHIKFIISGAGEIVSTANGNPTNFTSFHSHERDAFHGKALVVIRGKAGKSGQITVTATANGLASDQVIINSQ